MILHTDYVWGTAIKHPSKPYSPYVSLQSTTLLQTQDPNTSQLVSLCSNWPTSMLIGLCRSGVARILEPSKIPVCHCPSFLCLFVKHITHIKDKVPAWWFYQITEQDEQCRDANISGSVPYDRKSLPLYFLWHFGVTLLCKLLFPVVSKSNSQRYTAVSWA